MRSLNTKFGAAAIGLPAAVAAVAAPAGAFDNDFWWADEPTLALGSNANEVGFWQHILFSNGRIGQCEHDGQFGPQTRTATMQFQVGVLGFSGSQVDGVVGPVTWHSTQLAVAPGPSPFSRLQYTGYHYGNWGYFYTYYGGSAIDAQLFWNSTSTWKWRHPGTGVWYDTSATLNSIADC